MRRPQSRVVPDLKEFSLPLVRRPRELEDVLRKQVARHMTGLETDSSNFSGSPTSPIYLEQPRTFADSLSGICL